MRLTQKQVLEALATEPGSGYPSIYEDALRDLDEAMKDLRHQHDDCGCPDCQYFKPCGVDNRLRAYFGDGNG